MRKSLFPDDNAIQAIAETKQVEATALPPGPEKHKLQKEANSYKILSEAKSWLSGELRVEATAVVRGSCHSSRLAAPPAIGTPQNFNPMIMGHPKMRRDRSLFGRRDLTCGYHS
jgi:hypothetical protein